LPQVNGVTTVVRRIGTPLRARGHEAAIVAPRYPDFPPPDDEQERRILSIPFPLYPAIRLSLPNARPVAEFFDAFRPDLIHVHTEGPLGLAGRGYALRRGLPLVTSFHTNLPQYSRHYGVGVLAPAVCPSLTWFHHPAQQPLPPGGPRRAPQREPAPVRAAPGIPADPALGDPVRQRGPLRVHVLYRDVRTRGTRGHVLRSAGHRCGRRRVPGKRRAERDGAAGLAGRPPRLCRGDPRAGGRLTATVPARRRGARAGARVRRGE